MLHPISLMVILVTGVLMAGWTFQAMAQSVIVSIVHAPELSQGAVINNPTDGSIFSQSPITLSGSCPDNSYINLYDNNNFSGVAWCSANGSWQIVADLYSGNNVLLAQDFNTTADEGPATAPIEISYTPPVPMFEQSTLPAGSSAALPQVSTPGSPVLSVETNFSYQVFSLDTPFSWTITIKSGVPPYKLLISWGDGQNSTQAQADVRPATISHKYSRAGYYPVVVNIIDAKNQTRTIQLAALIAPPGAGGVINFNNLSKPPTIAAPTLKKTQWLWLAWPAYAAVLLMLVSYWMGERKEYNRLVKRHRPAA